MQGLRVVVISAVFAVPRRTPPALDKRKWASISAQLGGEPAHEGDACLDLRDLDIFVWLVRVADPARTADDRGHFGQLELPCLGGERHG